MEQEMVSTPVDNAQLFYNYETSTNKNWWKIPA